jgi:hypothetical protein
MSWAAEISRSRAAGSEIHPVPAHAGDLTPRDGGLGIEQSGRQGLDGLPDFQQPDPDRIEDQAIGQVGFCGGLPRRLRLPPDASARNLEPSVTLVALDGAASNEKDGCHRYA